jgi:NAD+ diphosphatase
MTFVSTAKPLLTPPENAFWFLFRKQRFLVIQEGENTRIPQTPDLEKTNLSVDGQHFFGMLNGQPCYVSGLESDEVIPEIFSAMELRQVFRRFETDGVQAAGLAGHLLAWHRNHQFCSRCGNPNEDKQDERAKICPECGLINYPRLSPAIIVAVIRDGKILLAHSTRFPEDFYSVLAGFVEPGETLEDCVGREVFEEVRVSVKNISYFGSQPWPFPDSLMVGFTAEYAGGEIKEDGVEISHADWFPPDRLPRIPPRISIARKLIDWFTEGRPLATPVVLSK